MRNMKTITRNFTHPLSGKTQTITYKYHPCEGEVQFGRNAGKPCRSPQTIQVGDHWYCSFHHPDKSKRRIAPSKLVKEKTGKWPFEGKKITGPVGRPRKYAATTEKPLITADSPGTTFATSLSEIIDQMAKESLRKHLSTLVAELEK